jgi:hypothetical protein
MLWQSEIATVARDDADVGGARAGDGILPSRTFLPYIACSQSLSHSCKSSCSQNASTRTLQACAPQNQRTGCLAEGCFTR